MTATNSATLAMAAATTWNSSVMALIDLSSSVRV